MKTRTDAQRLSLANPTEKVGAYVDVCVLFPVSVIFAIIYRASPRSALNRPPSFHLKTFSLTTVCLPSYL